MAATTTARKKTTAKKAVAEKPQAEPVAQPTLADTQPFTIQPKAPAEVEMTNVFELDGKWWQVRAKPTSAMVMQYLINVAEQGREVAVAQAVYDMLGREALNALASNKDVDEDDVQRVFTIVAGIFLGHTTGLSGN